MDDETASRYAAEATLDRAQQMRDDAERLRHIDACAKLMYKQRTMWFPLTLWAPWDGLNNMEQGQYRVMAEVALDYFHEECQPSRWE